MWPIGGLQMRLGGWIHLRLHAPFSRRKLLDQGRVCTTSDGEWEERVQAQSTTSDGEWEEGVQAQSSDKVAAVSMQEWNATI